MSEPPGPWPQFDASRVADEYMPRSADVLAEIQAAEASLRARYGDRITRITVGPALAAWLKRTLPSAGAPLIPVPWSALSGIAIVEDASLVNGRLRIHRGDAVEDWVAVPPGDPKWLVQIKEPEFPQFDFGSDSMAWMNGPLGSIQSAIRAQSAQIAENDETLRRMRAEADGDLIGEGARRPWWRRIWRRR